jgi:ABC-type Mn2+/Zn2+ transport system ATPase subunit
MFTEVLLVNWRGHEETRVPLSPFTVLVGGNGVGKSSVLEAMAEVWRMRSAAGIAPRRAQSAIYRRGCSASTVQLFASADAPAFQLDLSAQHGSVMPSSSDWATVVTLQCELSPKRIAAPSPVSKTQPEFDGFGTASTLAHLKLNHIERFNRVLDRTRKIVPLVRDFGLTVGSVEEQVSERRNQLGGYDRSSRRADGYVLDVSFEGAARIPAEAVSEGTLLAIGALTAIEAYDDVRTLLIDDLDRALHIEAQAQFVSILREIQKDNPEIQIVATTHSPLVVEHFTDDEVVVFGRNPEGKVIARRLSEHPKRAKIRSLNAGEFWVAELEHWVVS